MFELATGCTASYGSGSDVKFLLSCCEGCDVETRQWEQGMVWWYLMPTSKSNGENGK